MSCSPALLASNRLNAQKSTGPKMAEGEAASRLNAFRHTLAGGGDLLGPDEDAQLVARRTSAFSLEFKVEGEMGRVLAHRAALLSVRMEKLAEREMIAVAANKTEAMTRFDQERAEELTRWIETLESSDDPRPALAELEQSPEGVAYLADAWRTLRGEVNSGDRAASDRAELWLGRDNAETGGDMGDRIDSKIERLSDLAGSMTGLTRSIASARREAGLLARFDPSPEATLARRHEAAAERGMYRAIKVIADLRRLRGRDLGPCEEVFAPRSQQPPIASPPSKPPTPPAPLGSFRAELAASETSLSRTIDALKDLPMVVASSRKQRPDLRELARKRR